MNKGIAIIALTAALACSTSAAAPDEVATQGNETVAAADSTDMSQATSRELMDAKLKIAELSAQNRALQSALDAALPYAEEGAASLESCRRAVLDDVDFKDLDNQLKRLEVLAPYSEKISGQADQLKKFIDIANAYGECRALFENAYSAAGVDSVENRLLDIYDAGNGILTETQLNAIDSLYTKADGYLAAVTEFDKLMKAVDADTEQFRDNEKADKICAQEIERIMEENRQNIERIKEYGYISTLFDKYNQELKKDPRSRTTEIRENIGMMLGVAPQDTELQQETETDK
ncbi:MAG: hypothetical protein K2G06_03895 [Muribaculaceae bacterium]|nr:hypothetical protein [Muribaculaceae bacterium]